jgi:hypothetical protein
MQTMNKIFGEKIIGCGLWPPHFTYVTPCEFILWWGYVKDKFYQMSPNMEELTGNI